MLVFSVGAAPAQAQTKSAWIPLKCLVFGSVVNHVAAALTATFPDTVAPGDNFNLTNITTTVVLPPGSQNAGAAVFPGSTSFEGVNTDFETNLTNASASFAPATVGGVPAAVVSSSPTQFNTVGAVQPPNQPASGNPHIDGGDTTRSGFQPSTPLGSFSFGDIPIKSPNPPAATVNTYGPAPGLGGGPNPTDGTPDVIPVVGPIAVTGAAGQDVVIKTANPGGPEIGGTPPAGPKVADNTVNFQPANSAQAPADCAIDTTITDNGNPNQGDGTGGTFTDQFTIPIAAVGAPAVNGLSPNHGPAAGGTSVTITGSNFTGATAVSFGGTAATPFMVDNDGQITAVSPTHAAGRVDVSVTTPNSTSPNSANDDFTYGPAVTGLNPNHGPAAGGNQVTITGTEFTGTTAVTFGANNATNVAVNGAGTQITATAPAGTGTLDVRVTTPDGTSANTAADDYAYDAASSGGGTLGTYTPTPTPAGAITVGGAKLKSPTKAVLTVTVPGAGDLTATDAKASARALRASASKKKKALIKKSSAHASQAGPVKLTLKLSAAGKKALNKKGKVKVKVKVKFTPSGASSSSATSATKSVTFKK